MPPDAGAIMPPRDMVFDFVSLQEEPDAPISYSYVPPKPSSSANMLVLYLNGLMSAQASWIGTISAYLRENPGSHPALLTYDRYGQGRTIARDPRDEDKASGQGHDCLDAAQDAHALIHAVCKKHGQDVPEKIVLVGNSIGCAIARLFTNEFPGTVAGLVLLDSIMADTDFISLFPDVDAPDFDPSVLPEGVSVEVIRQTRHVWKEVFHPTVPNKEGLNRANLRTELLPYADRPRLQGYAGNPPCLTVVGHDPEYFAEESEKGQLKTPKIISMTYVNPRWHAYNQGLVKLAPRQSQDVVIAKDCGHFVQLDGPQLVSDLVNHTLRGIS